MSEGNMWARLRERMEPYWREATRHEDKLHRGIADVSYVSQGGHHGWIELKYLREYPKRAGTPVRIDHFTSDQRYWLKRKGAAGGYTWLLLQVQGSRLHLLFHWNRLEGIGQTLTAAELAERCVWSCVGLLDYASLGRELERRHEGDPD